MLRRQLIDMTPEDVKGHLERLRARRNGQGKLLTDEMEVKRKHAEGKMGRVGGWATVEYELNRAPRHRHRHSESPTTSWQSHRLRRRALSLLLRTRGPASNPRACVAIVRRAQV